MNINAKLIKFTTPKHLGSFITFDAELKCIEQNSLNKQNGLVEK